MYQFWLDNEVMPISPADMKIKVANNNKTITLINDGEVNILKRPGLSKITFGLLLPNVKYPFSTYINGFKPAKYFLANFERLKNSLKPFNFKVIRTESGNKAAAFDSDFTVSLEAYDIIEDASKYGLDVFVNITLLQYKGYVTKTITFQDEGGVRVGMLQSERDNSAKPVINVYVVKANDSLWNIAKLNLGSGERHSEIYSLNKDVIEAAAKEHGRDSSSNGWWIYSGTKLRLPT